MSQYPSSVPRSPRLSNMLGAAPVTSEDGALTPHHASDHPSPPPRGLASHPDQDAPPGWARSGPCPRPSENYIPPWARAVSPAELSSVPQDQASSPGGFTALGLEKRGCWHGQVEARPSRPFCSPAPTACLPDRFQGRSGPFIPAGSSTPSTSPCLPPSTQTSARGLAQPCKSGSLPEVKFPSSRQ